MKIPFFGFVPRGLKYVLVCAAVFFLVMYVVIALSRVSYPFEIEWMEGGAVIHVQRLLLGEKLYVPPSIHFTPFIYNPLYFYVAAAVSKIIGVGFFPLRLVAFISSLGCFAVIFFLVRQETRSSFSAFVSLGLFTATFKACGAWFDIGRVDSLFLLFFLLAIYVLRQKDSPGYVALAGILIVLSFMAKQTALVMSLPIMLYLLVYKRPAFLVFTLVVFVSIAASALVLDWLHDGWYSYYIYYLPRHFPIAMPLFLVLFWTGDLAGPMAIACCLAIFYFLSGFNRSKEPPEVIYFFTTAGMLLGSWMSRVALWGWDNALMPAYAVLCILFGMSMHKALRWIEEMLDSKKTMMQSFIYLVCLVQFASLTYNPVKLVPTRADLAAGKQFIERLKSFPGDVFIPYHPYYAVMAGKNPYALSICMSDVWRGDNGPIAANLVTQLKQALDEKRFSAVIVDTDVDLLGLYIGEFYTDNGSAFSKERVFFPVTDLPMRPSRIYVPGKAH
jgi:hypothetical protein